MEAFMEGYHVMSTHPQLQHAQPTLYDSMYARERGPMPDLPIRACRTPRTRRFRCASMELLSEGMAGMIHAKEVEIARAMVGVEEGLPEDPNQAVMMWLRHGHASDHRAAAGEGRASARSLRGGAVGPDQRGRVPVPALFPAAVLHQLLWPIASVRSAPRAAFFEIWSLTMFPEGEEPDPVMEPIMLPYDSADFPPIPRQDYSNIPIQQKGMHAKGFEFMRLAHRIEGMISNYQRIIDGYLAGVPAQKLAAANQLLGGNFDGGIEDLGF